MIFEFDKNVTQRQNRSLGNLDWDYLYIFFSLVGNSDSKQWQAQSLNFIRSLCEIMG